MEAFTLTVSSLVMYSGAVSLSKQCDIRFFLKKMGYLSNLSTIAMSKISYVTSRRELSAMF